MVILGSAALSATEWSVTGKLSATSAASLDYTTWKVRPKLDHHLAALV